MVWFKRLLAVLLVLALSAVAIIAFGVLGSFDWERRHRRATEALPRLEAAKGTADIQLVQIEHDGMRFRARIAGLDGSGPGLILLHGFPETSAMWTPLIERAVAAGYRVVAFDQRGYSPGARPEGVAQYVVPNLTADVIAIADAVGFERFHLVGHDWGCVVGWGVTIQHPDRVMRWTGLSIPHPGALLSNLRQDLPVYIKIFTAPWVPEAMLGWNDLENLRDGAYAAATPAQREEYLAVFSEPGALTGALNWYRAITSSLDGAETSSGPVEGVPTLFMWGTREEWVTDEALVLQCDLVNAPYIERELEAGHFLMQDQPDAVIEAVLGHMGAS